MSEQRQYIYVDKASAYPDRRWGKTLTAEEAQARYSLDASQRHRWFGVLMIEEGDEHPSAYLRVYPRGNGITMDSLNSQGAVESSVIWSPYHSPSTPRPYEGNQDRIFLTEMTEYTYPDEEQFYFRTSATEVLTRELRPDGYLGETRIMYGDDPTVETRESDSFDSRGYWFAIPQFGDWDNFFFPKPQEWPEDEQTEQYSDNTLSDLILALSTAMNESSMVPPVEDWESFTIVTEFGDGYHSSYGYAYTADKVHPVACSWPKIKPAFTAYLATKYNEGDKLPIKVLVQFERMTGNYNVLFEDSDESRWKVTPTNHMEIRETLRPKFPSILGQVLSPNLPDGITIPNELDRAWSWMERQGWGAEKNGSYFVTPYAGDRQLGMVFAQESLDGWFDPWEPGFRQLFPFAEISGDGGTAALWLHEGQIKFVALGSEGETFLLADSAVDFLRLAAIGYDGISSWDLDGAPDDEEAVEAHAPFRNWVETEFNTTVPSSWALVDPDPFSGWVSKMQLQKQTGIMVEDWAPGIVEMVTTKQQLAAADTEGLWPVHLPRVAAAEDEILETEQTLAVMLDPEHRNFLTFANGWVCIHQEVTLFSTQELVSGPLREAALEAFSHNTELLEEMGWSVDNLLPIAASLHQPDVYFMVIENGVVQKQVVWLALGEVIETYDHFKEYFASLIKYTQRAITRIQEEGE